jgi:hypothetical protein
MTNRTLLLTSVAAAALASGMASKAVAFEVVDWDWTKTVTSIENITVNTNVNINFNGLVELEKWQLSFGDITSTAVITGVTNNPGGGTGGGEGSVVTANIGGNVPYVDGGPTIGIPDTANVTYTSDNPNVTITPIGGGNVDEQNNEVDLGFTVTVQVDPTTVGGTFDAVDLPGVVNASTAVANNQAITTTTALQLHDLQIAAGSFNALDSTNETSNGPNALAFLLGALGLFEIDDQLEGINEQYDMAALTILGAATGFINPAHITSVATVASITNAFVDNSSTAVGNNAAFTINASIPGNAYFIGDVTQLLIGNVTSAAVVADVTINNYTGFGAAGFGLQADGSFTPIVKNVSTAVGNNLVINVNGCGTCTPVVGGP